MALEAVPPMWIHCYGHCLIWGTMSKIMNLVMFVFVMSDQICYEWLQAWWEKVNIASYVI